MNRTYSIVWSAVRNMYVVASELARGHSKVKIQAHANEVALSIEKPESGWIISAKHNALAFAIVAALGFASPLAMADNSVSYIDGVDHDLNAETSPISYSGTGQGTALYLEGLPTQNQGWQPTSGTGTGVVIETDGGGALLPDGSSHAAATAVKLTNGAMLNLTDAVITTSGEYAMGIELSGQSSIMLTGGTLLAGGNYGIMTLSGESQATLSDIKVTATAETGSDVVSQEGSTLNITDGSEITLTRGQLRVVGSTTGNAFLNVSDSTVSSTGTDSTVIASNKGVLDITNSTVMHDNAKGAAIEAGNASTVTISGDNKNSMVITSEDIGIKSAKSSVNIDGATIIAKGDGILMTTGGSSFYSNNSGLTVNNADVTSDDAAALHVDKNTVIEKPITLTDSTLTGSTAIKLDNAATVEANNTTLNGNIDAGSTVSSLSLAEKSSLQGSVNGLNSSLTLDETSQWNMTDPSTVGNLTNDGGITLGNASDSTGTLLTVDNTLTLQDGSQINATLDTANSSPIIKATNVTLDGTLNLSSTATFVAPETDEHLGSFTLIDSQTAITTDFDSVTLDADISAMPDYLTINAGVDANDNTNYELSTGLSWYAGANSTRAAHGTFTVDAGSTFTVTSELDETTATSNWDGSKLTKQGDGTLILSNTGNDYGDTEIDGGILAAKDAASLGTGDVTIAENATLALSQGTLDNNVTGGGQIVKTGNDELIVTGDYTGNGGSLYLNTVLGDDDSATDKLVISGDASGTTDLYINGIGNGAQTTNGIEVVDVGGTSTSDAFVLKNEVNASLYTYRLYWNESDNDWYLASKAQSDDDDSGSDVTPPDDDSDVTPSDDGDDGGNVTPPDDGGDVAPQYRADIGAYMGNQWMARNLQMQTLYDREGSQYRNADGSVWARFKAGKAESEAVSGNIDMDSNYSQFQLGGDILAWGNGQQSVTVGVMASYINADTDSTGNRGADGSQFTSSGNVDGYNLGVYATWFADAQTHSGAYVDSWYQYGFYNNSVESGDAGSESYDSTANAVSLETGYRYDIALNNGNTVSLTPQAQVVWQNYSADSVKDNYGTRIDGQDGDSWTTRLGLRVDGKLYKGSRTVIQPFAEANWLHTSDDVSVSFDDATVKQYLPANRAELKVGLQADIDKQWSVRAQVAGQTGSNDFGDLNGSLNLRYNW
ncbi:autotransporter outer membrane beta-barrel domain-containing protein [Salmonella enterica]|nr:autotransporter outer membrane beta-barrel domain-containing protein [Salmonella enterica]